MNARLRSWLLPPFAVFFAAGLLLGREADSFLYGLAACVLSLSACLMLRERWRFFALLVLALSLGCFRGYFAWHPSLPPEGSVRVSGIISEEVEFRAGGQVRSGLTHVTLDDVRFSGGAYWSFYTDEVPSGLQPGQQVTFQAVLYHPSGASNPDGYDFRENLLRRGILIGLYGNQDLSVGSPESFSLAGQAAALRHRLINALLSSPLGEDAGEYAAAMILGYRSFLPREDRTAFSRLGIAHILSVSGFHVGILIVFLALIFRLLHLPQGIRLILYSLLLAFYVILCGNAQPVLRASLLLLFFQYGRMLNRPRLLTHLLCAVFFLMLLWSPVQLTGLSFQLSFGAVAGLALITPFLSSLIAPSHPFLRRLGNAMAAGIGAQVGILLPQLNAFQELPLLGLFLNIPLLLVSSLLIVLYWLALISLPFPGLSVILCLPARWLTSVLLAVVRFLGEIPGITLWTPAPGFLTVIGLLLLTAGLCSILRWGKRSRLLMSGIGLLVIVLSLIPLPHHSAEYIQFSVGNSDAALLWDQSLAYVIDTGNEDGIISDYLHRRRLSPDAVILTHLHSDHAGGLRSLMEDRIPIPVLYIPDGAADADIHPDMLLLLEKLRSGGTDIRILASGDQLPLPSGEIEVIWPERGKTRPGQDANESSLTMRLSLRGTSLLQTGDLDGRYEMYAAAPADILKVPHHGSLHSASPAFLNAVHPLVSLLSCDSLDRHWQFRQRLPESSVLYSTAAEGMLTVHFQDNFFSVETFFPLIPDTAPESPAFSPIASDP